MDLAIIGWVWLGIITGMLVGVVLTSVMNSNKQSDLEAENQHLKFVRESLKEEIFRLDNQVKPKPRSKRRRK
jgi:MFS superfamily sulfate permease-like transporter